MEKNCSCKQFKKSVNNPNLEKYGIYTLYGMLNSNTSEQHLLQVVVSVGNTVMATISGATFGDVSGDDITKIDSTHIQLTGSTGNLVSVDIVGNANAIFSIEFEGKYFIKRLSCIGEKFLGFVGFNDNLKYAPIVTLITDFSKSADFTNYLKEFDGVSVNGISNLNNKADVTTIQFSNVIANGRDYDLYKLDIANLSDFTSLTKLNLQYAGNKVTGNLSVLAELTSITELAIAGTAISGQISSLGEMINLTKANFYNCDIVGTVESFVQAQRLAGRSTESTGITIQAGFGNYVTMGGVIPPAQPSASQLTWTADSITYGSYTVEG